MNEIRQPLSNLQLEILKAFSYNLDNDELLELKEVLANFFADRAIHFADKAWEEKKWTDEDVEKMLKTKMRKSKK